MFRLVFMVFILYSFSFAGDKPIVGAIRWDAWTGGHVTKQVERSLAPQKYHNRLPWFSKVLGKNKVRIDGSPQRVMDKEIQFASDAGLDYWAFLLYPKSGRMSMALKQYLKSSQRDKINFSLIMSSTLKVSAEKWAQERDRAVALLKEPGYQTVLNGRPLVYFFKGKSFSFDRFTEFRKTTHRAGFNPYFVFMGWNPVRDYKIVAPQGFDAVSAYAKSSKKSTFSGLAKQVEKNWKNAAKARIPYVPLVTTGWDKRPRQNNPVSWEKKNAGYMNQKVFPATAKPGEIATHLSDAIFFVRTHPQTCLANAIIIYAWNEHDEGGWLSPTWQENGKPNTDRINAIRQVLLP